MLDDMEEEEGEESESLTGGELGIQGKREGCYEIIGTLKDKTNPKPEFVKEVIQVIFDFI